MGKCLQIFAAGLCIASLVMFGGCSNSPSDQEMRQLTELKENVARLEGQVKEKEREKASLEKEVADKNSKLQQCQSDQDAVKKAMGK